MSPVLERNAQTQVEQSTKIKTLQFAIFALLALFAAMAIALPIGLSASID